MNAMNNIPPFSTWNGHGNENYNRNPELSYKQKPYFEPYNRQPMVQNNPNEFTLHVIQDIMELLMKNVQGIIKQMHLMARKVE